MTTFVSTIYKTLLIATATLAFTSTVQAAGYIKFDGVEGESVRQHAPATQPSTVQKLNKGNSARIGLLLPAVQKVREAANTSPSPATKSVQKGTSSSAGDEHEIEYDVSAGV